MKKLVAVIALSALTFGVACTSSGSSAESKYNAYVDKYGPVFSELAEAFGDDTYDADESFEDWVANLSAEDCEPLDSEAAAFGLVLLGPIFTEKGLSYTEFVKDTNALVAAVKAEGKCGGGVSAAPSSTTSTTSPIAATCAEAAGTVSEGLDAISSGLDLYPYVSAADQAEFVQTSREFIQTSIATLSLCRSLDPAQVDTLISGLQEVDRLLGTL